jgi:putative acetyltransferase
VLLGCGALKELDADARRGEVDAHAEGAAAARRRRALLAHIVDVARSRGYERLSLETGSQAAFQPAQQLYASFGFTVCGPFEGYVDDPNSVFMTLRL